MLVYIVMPLPGIREVSYSNLDRDTVSFQAPSGKYYVSTLN
jgi:hypothetical protein